MINERPEERLSTEDIARGGTAGQPEPEAGERATETHAEGMQPEPARPAEAATPRPEPAATAGTADDTAAPLFEACDAQSYRSRWDEVQAGFVDDPRRAVEQADSLVSEVIKRLAESFADERKNLEGQWGRGDDISTEDLRMALRRYRSFFDQLLSV